MYTIQRAAQWVYITPTHSFGIQMAFFHSTALKFQQHIGLGQETFDNNKGVSEYTIAKNNS